MKRLIIPLLISLLPLITVAQKGHKIEVEIEGLHTGNLYLGHYYGKSSFLIDTVAISEKGAAIFAGDQMLPGGIYFILLPNKKTFYEVLINQDQSFKIRMDTSGNISHLSFQNSPLNSQYKDYTLFLRTAKPSTVEEKDSAGLQQEWGEKINNYRGNYMQDHPTSLLTTLFKAMNEPQVPPQSNADSNFAYQYYKNHYWDQFSFEDSSLVRTPILETRLNRFFNTLLPKVADSINFEADQLLKKAAGQQEIFKYILWWLTSNFERSQIMGMDAVFVHLVEKYYVSGEAPWVSEDQLRKMIDKASKIAPNLIGNTAPDIALKTLDSKTTRLSDIQAKYTVLAFWDPTCGHCKKVIPELDNVYREDLKQKGVKIIGILAGGTKEQWVDFINDHRLTDWLHLWDPEGQNLYRSLYDVYKTPILYLLDQDKKIVAKQITVKQLEELVDHLEKRAK